MNNIYKSAFTLAEVLITLSIVGIIAAMTIPGLINKTGNVENVVALKKVYSTLTQAFYRISSENGGIENALSTAITSDSFANIFIQKLKLQKNCGTNNANDTGCYSNSNVLWLKGTSSGSNPFSRSSAILTVDGISYSFYLHYLGTGSQACGLLYGEPSNPFYGTCGYITVDVNGPNKGPFQYGRDIFRFYVTKKGIYPDGFKFGEWWIDNDCNLNSAGQGCAAKILTEGTMNY